MKWFEGNVAQAVQAAKVKKSVFIVYIFGDDKISEEVSAVFENENVETIRKGGDCVAVKIKANSEDCGFFSQIYPVVIVPSIFFIGENGVPLEVTGGSVSVEELVGKLKKVIEVNKGKGQTVNEAKADNNTENVSQSTDSTSSSQSDSGARPKENIQTRVEQAQDLIAKKREEKLQKEFEESKRKEEEKRQLGKDLQKLKQFQKEREILEVQQQLKKDKEEDRIARQKVKEQIARDRAERAAKFNKEKTEREESLSEAKKAKLQAEQKEKEEAEARRSETARIQFRLPDGSSIPHSFPSGETFQTVHQFISQHVGGQVVLSTTFPRRTFSEVDFTQTLMELQLAPSAVLMVMPKKSSSVPSGSVSSSGDIMSLLMAPFMFLLNLFRSLFGGVTSSPPPQPSSSPSTSSATGGDRQTNQANKRSTPGNIRRFRNAQDDDDENATWNGNSTQQM